MRSQRSAILHGKCPRCREGDIFQYPAGNIARFNRINNHCPTCGITFHPEPGFYVGAMYVSYAFTIAIIIAITVVLYLLDNANEWVYGVTIIVAMIVVAPFNYRYSRIIYLYSFGGIKYDPSLGHKNKQ